MKMNPLSVDSDNFIVCEAAGSAVAFGQIRKLAGSNAADPSVFDAPPGSAALDADADDDAWDDFEEEFKSLPWVVMPWSPAYQQLQKRASLQRMRRRARVAAAEARASPLWELASIYVEEEWRGRGLGRSLVRRLLQQYEQRGYTADDLYLLTLEPTVGWYRQFGFEPCSRTQVPPQMGLEVAAGEVLSTLLGNKLVCMRGNDSS